LAWPVAAAKIIRLRNANPCGVDADRTKWSNVAFVSVLSSIAAAVLGMLQSTRIYG